MMKSMAEGLAHIEGDAGIKPALINIEDGWQIESIQPARVEVRPDLKDFSFSEGGPKAWFAVIRRPK